VVVPNLRSTPKFDERFLGYGKNKIQWVQHLRFSGFEFHVLPSAYVVHCPHPPSVSRQNWAQYRGKKDRLFRDFITERMRNATIRTTMCGGGARARSSVGSESETAAPVAISAAETVARPADVREADAPSRIRRGGAEPSVGVAAGSSSRSSAAAGEGSVDVVVQSLDGPIVEATNYYLPS